MAKIVFFLISLTSLYSINDATTVIGISPNRLPLYDSSKDFTCLDGSKVIRFSSVNDDYCDCSDGSDEPGTSACPNGRFFCQNNGYMAVLLPSSRVNDGICDCCDGTDEYEKKGLCSNNCLELGKEYREQKKKDKEVFDQGVSLREQFSQEGKKKKDERVSEIEDLQKQADAKKELAEQLKDHKEAAEVLESEAKSKHDNEWEETIKKIKEEKELQRANTAFSILDIDKSGRITVQDLTAAAILDKQYTEEEAKNLLGDYDSLDSELFVSQFWKTTFKNIFNKTKPAETGEDEAGHPAEVLPTETTPSSDEHEIPPSPVESEDENADERDLDSVTGNDDDMDDIDQEDDDDDEDDDDEHVSPPASENNDNDDDDELPTKPDYDEETKELIEAADKVRKEYDGATREKDDLLKKLADVDRLTKTDMGDDEEFSPLQGQCFELSDREYTYKLCPFEKASQSSKSGGSEVSLGIWGEWTGVPDKHTEMKFINGLGCWNGPNRSTVVKLQCGVENEVVSVTEPNKCEYEFIFKTPAACHPAESHVHDEF